MEGRISRSRYFWTTLVITLAMYAVSFAVGVAMGLMGAEENSGSVAGFIVGTVAAITIGIQAVKRLHDMDRPGAHYWLFLVPFYNIYLGFTLLFTKGTNGPNRFGTDPSTT